MNAQPGWAWCNKCEGLWYSGGVVNGGVCPAGGPHTAQNSAAYSVPAGAQQEASGPPPRGGLQTPCADCGHTFLRHVCGGHCMECGCEGYRDPGRPATDAADGLEKK